MFKELNLQNSHLFFINNITSSELDLKLNLRINLNVL